VGKKPYYRAMTVADIRRQPQEDHVTVMFLESARFYLLPVAAFAFEESMKLLDESLKTQKPYIVGTEAIDTDVILEVRAE
jgi:hypothetical protein